MKLLDLFRCQGGATAGYIQAGWDVTGVDNAPRHLRYGPGETVLDDALSYLSRHGREYDAIHTSPPCQGYTRGNAGRDTTWPKLIPEVRHLLEQTGKLYVIENVTDAAWDMHNPVALCGCMFNLSTTDTDEVRIHLKRERLFETNWNLTPPRACDHTGIDWWAGAYGGARRDRLEAKHIRKGGYVPRDKTVVAALLGVEHHMTWEGLFECLPPAYTHHIGTQMAVAL